jgi:DNA-binding NarL/FixJ family response regulator
VDTVAICDTEPIVIEGLRSLLASQEGLLIVASGDSPAASMQFIRDHPPRVVLIDKAFGVPAVLDFVKSLRRGQARTAAVVWGASVSEAEALRFLQAGALGVVSKGAPLDDLLACLRAAALGQAWTEGQAHGQPEWTPRQARSPLTAREGQIVELIGHGMKNREIAGALGITIGTVKIHLKHIFEKTGVHGRYGLALAGLKAQEAPHSAGADAG